MARAQKGDPMYRLGFDYAWGWFSLHSGQRMHLVSFWLVTVAAASAGLAPALAGGSYGAAALVAAAEALVTVGFRLLDHRTRVLIGLAERVLTDVYEADLAKSVGTASLRLVADAECSKTPRGSYRAVLGALHLATVTGFGLLALVCVGQLVAGAGS